MISPMLSYTLSASRRAMSRIDMGGVFACFKSLPWFQYADALHTAPPETKLATAVEMLEGKEARLECDVRERTREARTLVTAGKKHEAKQKLRECQLIRKRLTTNQGMLLNLRNMMSEIEDTKMYTYSIDAMSSVAKEYNYSSANLDGLHKRLTSAQDRLIEFHDQSGEINAVLSENMDNNTIINDEDLEAELESMLAEDAPGDTLESVLPTVPTARVTPAHQVMSTPHAGEDQDLRPTAVVAARELRARFDLVAS
jgi:hypothetical protein